MINWITAHPWMTFFLAYAVLELVSHLIANICVTIQVCHGYNKTQEEETENGSSL